ARVEGRRAKGCAYALRRAGADFEFLVVLVVRGGDQPALRKRLRELGGEEAVEVDVAGRMASYVLGDGRTTVTQLAVPAGHATLVVQPGLTLAIDATDGNEFDRDRRRDGAVNIARAVLGEPFVRSASAHPLGQRRARTTRTQLDDQRGDGLPRLVVHAAAGADVVGRRKRLR
ncbi:MAG: hypothetical protein H0W96_11750, partial [Solirubrobacterales bacterium]|nr:hypothetical protein [Solirubrobacterales bacterium]